MTGYITNTYHVRVHSETHQTPLDAWRGTGFVPRLPDNLEALDLLLVMHAKPRTVRRDGIHFQGLRYSHTTLAAYVGEAVTIRYDPRDLSEIRVFYHIPSILVVTRRALHDGLEISTRYPHRVSSGYET